MSPDDVVNIFQEALTIIGLLASPLLLSGLAIGLFVGMFQAATQINEMTLSFVPKLIVMAVTAIIAGPWMLRILTSFTENLYTNIPNMIG